MLHISLNTYSSCVCPEAEVPDNGQQQVSLASGSDGFVCDGHLYSKQRWFCLLGCVRGAA